MNGLRLVKMNRIKKFLELYNDSPNQGTVEWKEARKKTIGGSEISIVFGQNPFKNMRQLVESKLEDTWKGNVSTWWGKLFECIIKKWCEMIFETEIIGSNAYFRGIEEYECFSYSPDGLGVANLNENIYNSENKIIGHKESLKIVLFEFKAPMSKKINKNEAPVYYVPQVKTGLELIRIAEVGILIEIVFRRCAWEDLNFSNEYNKIFHKDKLLNTPFAIGVIYICAPNDFKTNDKYKKLLQIYEKELLSESETVDFGICSDELFNETLSLLADELLVRYNSQIVNDPNDEYDFYKEFLLLNINIDKKLTILGVLPYKIMDLAYHPINKEFGYLDDVKDTVKALIDVVNRSRKDLVNKKKILDDYFNNTDNGFIEV